MGEYQIIVFPKPEPLDRYWAGSAPDHKTADDCVEHLRPKIPAEYDVKYNEGPRDPKMPEWDWSRNVEKPAVWKEEEE